MKKILVFAAALSLAGCGQQQSAKEADKTQTTATAVSEATVTSFEAYLKTLPHQEASVSKATEYFHKNFDKNSSKELNDKAFMHFMLFHRTIGDSLSRLAEDAAMETMTAEEKIQTPEVKQRIKDMAAVGLRPEPVEGTFVIIQDPAFLEKEFKDYFSPNMQEYFEQFKKEQNQNWTDDGGMLISPKELADRAVWWEKFNAKNPDFLYRQENEAIQQGYVATLFTGMNNTPAFNYETNVLNPEFKQAYEYITASHADTKVAKEVGDFYKLLSESGFKKTAKVEQYLKKYTHEGEGM